jgi:hypothetical protein
MRKQGKSTSGTSCILHNSRKPTTTALYLNVFYIKLYWRILKIPQIVEFPHFSPSGMSVHFIPYGKIKALQSRKYTAGNWIHYFVLYLYNWLRVYCLCVVHVIINQSLYMPIFERCSFMFNTMIQNTCYHPIRSARFCTCWRLTCSVWKLYGNIWQSDIVLLD